MLMDATDSGLARLHLDAARRLLSGQDPVCYASLYSKRISVLQINDNVEQESACKRWQCSAGQVASTKVSGGVLPLADILKQLSPNAAS